jgi:hypothetical protein
MFRSLISCRVARRLSRMVSPSLPVRRFTTVNNMVSGFRIPSRMMATKTKVRQSIDEEIKNTPKEEIPQQLEVVSKREVSKIDQTSMTKLYMAISQLEGLFDIKLGNIARIIIVGLQSSGKTSVVEAIASISHLLPVGIGMSTKKPIRLTLVWSEETKFQVRDTVFKNEKDASEMIHRLNENPEVKHVDITIYSPNVCNSHIVDYPGCLYVMKSNRDMPAKIEEMTREAIKDPNSIPVLVVDAGSDIATNKVLALIEEYKRDKDALGVVTKADRLDNLSGVIDILKNKENPNGDDSFLGRGWVAVVLRNKEETDTNMTVKEKEVLEKQFFDQKTELRPSGVHYLRETISRIQLEKMRKNRTSILNEIDAKIQYFENSGSFLDNIVGDPKSDLVVSMKMMIEKVVSSSHRRGQMESTLSEGVKTKMDSFIKNDGKFNNNEKDLSEKRVDKRIYFFHQNNKTSAEDINKFNFSQLLNLGLVSPHVVNQQALDKVVRNEVGLACLTPMIDWVVDDDLGVKRNNWITELEKHYTKLLENDNVQTEIYKIMIDVLLTYIRSGTESMDDRKLKFIDYVVRRIGEKAFNENIQYSIKTIINIEKRPNLSFVDLCRELALLYPSYFTFGHGFFEFLQNPKKKLKVELYSEVFNKAYLRGVSKNKSHDAYRIIAVCMLDKMLGDLLNMMVDLLHKDSAKHEKDLVDKKIKKLRELRNIIATSLDN